MYRIPFVVQRTDNGSYRIYKPFGSDPSGLLVNLSINATFSVENVKMGRA